VRGLVMAIPLILFANFTLASSGQKVNPEVIGATMRSYIAAFNSGDVAAISSLYRDDAVVEDPAGSTPLRGKKPIEQFYKTVTGSKLEPVSFNPATDGTGALFFQIRTGDSTINVIDIMTFDHAGKIATMKAYSTTVPGSSTVH
jgi:steroid Delta-isomerase